MMKGVGPFAVWMMEKLDRGRTLEEMKKLWLEEIERRQNDEAGVRETYQELLEANAEVINLVNRYLREAARNPATSPSKYYALISHKVRKDINPLKKLLRERIRTL